MRNHKELSSIYSVSDRIKEFKLKSFALEQFGEESGLLIVGRKA